MSILREKGRDLTQSYDKSPNIHWNSKEQRDNTKSQQKIRLHNNYGLTKDGQVELQQPSNWC